MKADPLVRLFCVSPVGFRGRQVGEVLVSGVERGGKVVRGVAGLSQVMIGQPAAFRLAGTARRAPNPGRR